MPTRATLRVVGQSDDEAMTVLFNPASLKVSLTNKLQDEESGSSGNSGGQPRQATRVIDQLRQRQRRRIRMLLAGPKAVANFSLPFACRFPDHRRDHASVDTEAGQVLGQRARHQTRAAEHALLHLPGEHPGP